MRSQSKARRWVTGLLTALALAFGVMLVSAPAATASPYSSWIDGSSPIDTGCFRDAKTVASAGIWDGWTLIGVVNLRWSYACGTNWAQVTRYDGRTSQYMFEGVYRPADNLYLEDHDAGYSTVYSRQLYARWTCAQADGTIAWDDGTATEYNITNCV